MSGPQIKSDSKYDDYDYPTTAPEVKSGHPGHTTPEQDAQVFQLRTQLEQAGYTERLDTLSMVYTLILLQVFFSFFHSPSYWRLTIFFHGKQLRFLRARKFNVELAKTMLVNRKRPFKKDFRLKDYLPPPSKKVHRM